MTMIGRRAFLGGLVSALAAPAVVRAASLMPVRAPKLVFPVAFRWNDYGTSVLGPELVAITRKAFVPRVAFQIYRESPLLAALQGAGFDDHDD